MTYKTLYCTSMKFFTLCFWTVQKILNSIIKLLILFWRVWNLKWYLLLVDWPRMRINIFLKIVMILCLLCVGWNRVFWKNYLSIWRFRRILKNFMMIWLMNSSVKDWLIMNWKILLKNRPKIILRCRIHI